MNPVLKFFVLVLTPLALWGVMIAWRTGGRPSRRWTLRSFVVAYLVVVAGFLGGAYLGGDTGHYVMIAAGAAGLVIGIRFNFFFLRDVQERGGGGFHIAALWMSPLGILVYLVWRAFHPSRERPARRL